MTLTPTSFVIEAISRGTPDRDSEASDTYVVSMQLKDTYEVRSFLSDNGVSEKRIAFAIAELGRTKQVTVNCWP